MTYSHGAFIHLCWPECIPEYLVVTGHVSHNEAIAAVNDHAVYYKICQSVHRYGRWGIASGEDGWERRFYDYTTPGRGRFPVTLLPVIGRRDDAEIDAILADTPR